MIPTANSIELIDAALTPPPERASKLILLSQYGVLAIGTYQPGFHIAWAPLPKRPMTMKEKK